MMTALVVICGIVVLACLEMVVQGMRNRRASVDAD